MGDSRVLTKTTDCKDWQCIKRDGRKVDFDIGKIKLAITRCLDSIGVKPTDEIIKSIDRLVVRVVNSLAYTKGKAHEVEQIQRHVVSQLWADGLWDAAEAYQAYREKANLRRQEKPISAQTQQRLAEDKKHFPTDLQYYQFISKFSRWLPDQMRRETWKEACYDRIMPWLRKQPLVKDKVPEATWNILSEAMYNLEVSPAMRVVQMAGPSLDRDNIGAFNCSASPIEDLRSIPEALYILMQGCGYGFSVESEYVEKFPRIKRQKKAPPEKHVVEDSTEGWCNALQIGFDRWFDGHDVEFDDSQVRPEGTPLKIKGGRASGPAPLRRLLAFCRNTILAKQGTFLTDLNLHDMMCVAGDAVHVGGVRRAALISLSDLDSIAMRDAKKGNWFVNNPQRGKANNSAVFEFDGTVPSDLFMEEWLALAKSGSGERGIFNRNGAQKHRPRNRKKARYLINPCGEIILRPYGLCNLSIAIARHNDTRESLARKVRQATTFGAIQATLTRFNYVRDDWRKNAEEERLLGVDITGHADCPLLRYGAPGRSELIRYLAACQEETMKLYHRLFGIHDAAANRCVKPGGDSGVFFDCASGVSPRYARYQIRWVTESKTSPVAAFLKASGVPYANAPGNDALYVFGFPKSAPEGCTLRDDMTAIEQFKNWLDWKRNWADHSVSTTIYVEPHEWPMLGAVVYEHLDEVTSVAFLPKDNGTYTYAPNEEVTEAQYKEMVNKFPDLNWAKLASYENSDMTEAAQSVACLSGSCAF